MNPGLQTFPGIAYTVVYSETDEFSGLNTITAPVASLPSALWDVDQWCGLRFLFATATRSTVPASYTRPEPAGRIGTR